MSKRIILDSHPLSLLCFPNTRVVEVVEIKRWLRTHLANGADVFLPEIADYEVRRELLRAGKQRSIHHLDGLAEALNYVPITTAHMRRAAEMWATARNRGIPTAPKEALDADMILAAQAEDLNAIVVTSNLSHLSRFVQASHWRDLQP